jgi:hypothetical protein
MSRMIPVIDYYYGLPEKEKCNKKMSQESIATRTVHCLVAV